MADETVSSLGLDTSDFTQPLNELSRVIDAANQKILKLGQVMASLDGSGKIASLTIKSFKDGIGEVTKFLTPLLATKKDVKIAITADASSALKVGDILKEAADRFDADGKLIAKAGDTRFQIAGTSVKSIKEDILRVTPDIEKLAVTLAQLGTKGKTLPLLKTDPDNLLRNIARSERVSLTGATKPEIVAANKSILDFQQELAKVAAKGEITGEQLNKIFAGIAKGDLKSIPLALNDLLKYFDKMIERINAVGTSAKGAEAEVRQLGRANIAEKALIKKVDPVFQKKVSVAKDTTSNLTDVFDAKNVADRTNKEARNYIASITSAIKYFKESSLTLKEFQEASASAFSETPVQKYSGAQAILFDKLLKVRDTLRSVGGAAGTFEAKLAATADKASRERDFSSQFKNILGPIPTGVDIGLEKQIQRDIFGVGKESAKIKEAGFGLKELQDIAAQTATGIIADFTKIPVAFESVTKKAADLQQKLIALRAEQTRQAETKALEASRPQRIADVTARLEPTLISGTLRANASESEKAKLKATIQDLINAYAKLDNISLANFDAVVKAAATSATNSFQGIEQQLFPFARKAVEAYNQIGNAATEAASKKAAFSKAEQSVIGLAGQPVISPIVDEDKINKLGITYKNLIRKIAADQITLKIDDTGLQEAFDAAKQGVLSVINVADPNIQKLAISFLGLINNVRKFDTEHTKAFEKAKAETDKLAASNQTLADQQKLQATRPGVFDQVRKTTEQIQGPVSTFARAGDRQRVEAQISNISTAIAQGKITINDYVNALNQIRNKEIVPPDANQDINQLRNNVYSLVTAMQTASDRGLNFHKTLISVSNAARLLIVSQLYVAFSQIRQSISEAITVTNQLSIQIGQIQAITQNATASTEAWAESLRRVSDASGQNITDVSVAGYAALSNQITIAKKDTEEFLEIATELGRTVGSTPLESVNLLSSTINAFGKSASDARQLAAEFFKTVDIGKITIGDLNNILGRAGIAGAKLGVTTTEFDAALATLTINGLTTEDAITRLNNLFVKLINPTKEMTQLFRQFGTSPEQLIRVHTFAGALQEIEAAIKNGNAAIEDLFPEIRTLVGFLGLSGTNAIKFSQAIDKISHSIGEYNEASRLTSKEASFGQNLKEELNKIQNIFNVDIAQGFLKGLAEANTVIGGFSKRITDLIDVTRLLFDAGRAAFLTFYAFKGIAAIVAGVEATIVALGGALSAAAIKAAALRAILISFNPYTIGAAALTASFFGTLKVLELLEERSKKAFEALGKAGEVKFNTSSLKASIDNSVKESTVSFESASGSLARTFEKAFARVTASYNITIDKMKTKTEGLVQETKSALDSLDHILTRTISAVQNIPRETVKINRELFLGIIERREDTELKDLQNKLEAAQAIRESNSRAQQQVGGPGFTGPGQEELTILDAQREKLGKTAERLKKARDKVFAESYDPRQHYEAHKKYVDVLYKMQDEDQKLAHEATLSLANQVPGGPVSLSAGLPTAASDRAKIDFEKAVKAHEEYLKLDEDFKERSKKDQAPLLALKDKYSSLSKTITDFDLSKLANLAPITGDNGKIVETVQQQQEKILEPIRTAGKTIIAEFDKLKIPFSKADFLSDYEQDIENLKKKLDSLDDSRRKFGLATLDLNQFEKDKKAFINAIKEATDSVKIYDESIKDLHTSIGKTFGRIQQQISKLPIPTGGIENLLPLQKISGFESIKDQVNNLIDSLTELRKKREEEPTKDSIEGLKQGTEDSLKELDILEKRIQKVSGKNIDSIIKTGNLKELKTQLTEILEGTNRIQDSFKGQGELQKRIDTSTKTSIEQEFEFLTRLSKILTASNEDFRNFQSSASDYNEKVIATFKELTRQAKEATQALKDVSLPKDNSLVQPKSPIGAAVPGATVPGTETKIPEVSINAQQLNTLIEALKGTKPENITPKTESMGGLIPAYSEGGMVNYYNTSYLDKGMFVPKGTDTVPAMLTPEEYVMPADKTKKYRKILDAMREGVFPTNKENNNKDNINNYYADGGEVDENILLRFLRKSRDHSMKQEPSSANDSNKEADEIAKLLFKTPSKSKELELWLHGPIPRAKLTEGMRAKGYPESITPTTLKLLKDSFKGPLHDIDLTAKTGSRYKLEEFQGLLGTTQSKSIDIDKRETKVLPDTALILRHELEHVRQGASKLNIHNSILSQSREIPPSLADLVFSAQAFRKHTGKNVDHNINLGNVSQSADWMAKQGQEHGLFDGKSMTQLLATPSGKAYLKKLLKVEENTTFEEAMKEANELKKLFSMKSVGYQLGGIVKYYEEGGTIDEDTALQNLLLHWNKSKDKSVGSANKDASKIQNVLLGNISGSEKLIDKLWSEKTRKNLVDVAIAQGYPTKGITPASIEAMANNWKGAAPDIKLHQKQSYAEHFTSPLSRDTIGIGVQAGSLDALGTLRHELEHMKQNLKPENIPEDQEFWNRMKTMSTEIPPSLGDLAHISQVFKKHTKKPLSAQVELAPGIIHEADWMAKQADEHGFFSGKSMTELLATKSGQTYLKRLLDASKNKDKNIDIKGYATGGGVTGTDTVPARLTPGEYVMPVDQTRKYRKQLDAMRAGSFPIGSGGKGLSGGGADSYSFKNSTMKVTTALEDAIDRFVGLPIIQEEIGKALSFNSDGGSSSGGGVVGGSPELSFAMSRGGIVPNYNPNYNSPYNFSQVQTAGKGTRFYAEGGVVAKSDSYSNTMNINVTGETRDTENVGRKIGRAIQREVKRGNVKLS